MLYEFEQLFTNWLTVSQECVNLLAKYVQKISKSISMRLNNISLSIIIVVIVLVLISGGL